MFPKISFNLRKAAVFFVAVVLCVGIAGATVARPLAVGALTKLGIVSSHSEKTKSPSPTAARLPALPSPPTQNTTTLLDVYVTPYGFSPKKITIPSGPALITILDCTGRGSSSAFTLTQSNGIQSPVTNSAGGGGSINANLAPGQVVLADAKNPKLGQCEITVAP